MERNLRSFASRGSVALGDGRWAARRDGYTNLRRLSPQQGPTTAGPAQADLGNSDELAGTHPEATQEPSPPITKAPLAVAPICHPEGQVGHVGIQPSQRGAGRVVINGNGEREWPWAILTLPTRRFGRMAGGRKASGRVATFRSNRFRPLQPFWGGCSSKVTGSKAAKFAVSPEHHAILSVVLDDLYRRGLAFSDGDPIA